MRNIILPIIFLTSIAASGQTRSDSLHNFLLADKVSIYEYGAPLSTCETNFENLLDNWRADIVTNAGEYDSLRFSFYETISDSTKYNYYRNYFTSGEAVGGSIARQEEIVNGRKSSKLFIEPDYYHAEFRDQSKLPVKGREILTEEFRSQGQELLMRKFNIDTIDIESVFYEMDSTIIEDNVWGGYSSHYSNHKFHLASTEPISKTYIDIRVKKERSFDDLNMEEKRAFILEELLIERITLQSQFSQSVKIGDKVYVVAFRYKERPYQVYVVCDPSSNQVVWDHFFINIRIDNKK